MSATYLLWCAAPRLQRRGVGHDRDIDWVAHPLEKFGQDELIKPRAQYTGALFD